MQHSITAVTFQVRYAMTPTALLDRPNLKARSKPSTACQCSSALSMPPINNRYDPQGSGRSESIWLVEALIMATTSPPTPTGPTWRNMSIIMGLVGNLKITDHYPTLPYPTLLDLPTTCPLGLRSGSRITVRVTACNNVAVYTRRCPEHTWR